MKTLISLNRGFKLLTLFWEYWATMSWGKIELYNSDVHDAFGVSLVARPWKKTESRCRWSERCSIRDCLSCSLATTVPFILSFLFVSYTILDACSHQGFVGGERLWMTQVMGNLGQQVMLPHPSMNFSSMGLYLWNSMSLGQGSTYQYMDRITVRD